MKLSREKKLNKEQLYRANKVRVAIMYHTSIYELERDINKWLHEHENYILNISITANDALKIALIEYLVE